MGKCQVKQIIMRTLTLLLSILILLCVILPSDVYAAKGVITIINPSGPNTQSGTITNTDDDGLDINFTDENIDVGVGELVTYQILQDKAVNLVLAQSEVEILGGFAGDIVISPGEYKIVNSGTINGNIIMDGGSFLMKNGATLTGEITASENSNVFITDGSRVNGDIEGSMGLLVINSVVNDITILVEPPKIRITLIISDGETGRSEGFGFVTFVDNSDVDELDLDGGSLTCSDIKGRKIRVNEARSVNITGGSVSGDVDIRNGVNVVISDVDVKGELKLLDIEFVSFDNSTVLNTINIDQVFIGIFTRSDVKSAQFAQCDALDLSENFVVEDMKIEQTREVVIDNNQVGGDLKVDETQNLTIVNTSICDDLKITETIFVSIDSGEVGGDLKVNDVIDIGHCGCGVDVDGDNLNDRWELTESDLDCEGLDFSHSGHNKAYLGYPFPYPITHSAEIQVYIPEASSTAKLVIYDMLGRLISTHKLVAGLNQVSLKANELSKGLNLCSLVVDGKPVENRKLMVQ